MFRSALSAVKVMSHFLPKPQMSTEAPLLKSCTATFSRSFSAIRNPAINTAATPPSPKLLTSQHVLQPTSCLLVPVKSYKVKTSLYKRCKHCYFVRRKGRLFVECKAKGRHKQMQKTSKRKLFRE